MKLFRNIQESYNELRYNVSWPTQKQLINSAVLVLIDSIVIAFVIMIIDWIFERLMELIYSIGL